MHPNVFVVVKRPQHAEHMRDYTMVAKDEDGRVMFKYVLVVFARHNARHSYMRVTYSKNPNLIDPNRTFTYRQNTTQEGNSAAFLVRVLKELKHWKVR